MSVIGGADGPTAVILSGRTPIFLIAGVVVVICVIAVVIAISRRK